MKKIPFGWLPGSWGLKGKTRAIAQAEYELEGYSLERKLAEIQYEDSKELQYQIAKIDHKYKLITDWQFEKLEAEHTLAGVALNLRLLELEFEHGDMTQQAFDKEYATLRDEPYVAVINSEYDPALQLDGFMFEFDWNDKWIELLTQNGYTGISEEMIVQQWFEALCRGVIAENSETQPLPFNSGRVITRMPSSDGKTNYS